MNFHISYRPAGGIARVLFFGPVGYKDKIEAIALLVEKYRHRKPLRVLLDLRYARSKTTLEEHQKFIHFIAENPVLRRAFIAVLHPRGRWTCPLPSHGSCLCRLSSREFVVEAEAEAWLAQIKVVPQPLAL
ncbi:hypothetical protein ACJJI5_20505 [Microbulbifer sp. EKSA008]|uniref:hypothetical protein n=1 Tax=unclassified Microbulbifer TaxID=2619833 RepID=UPI0024AE47DF|nr:hypothetical protein [Microbulbifer sp. VAAF005]WHI48700.1 hypothetical protein P0078_10145 [Microbulbifer sp. VAAF005]